MQKRLIQMEVRQPLNGFTLVELLVVISIIALLVSILMPSLGRAREQAKRVVCSSNVRQQGIGFLTYASDYDDKYPFAPAPGFWPFGGLVNWDLTKGTPSWAPGTFESASQMTLHTENYLTEAEVFYCPSAETGKHNNLNMRDDWDTPAKQFSKASEYGFRSFASYAGYETWAGYGYDTTGKFYPENLWPTKNEEKRFKRRASKNPLSKSSTVMLSDIILENFGTEAVNWNNHELKGKTVGGNILHNDFSVKWVDLSETEPMLNIETRQFNFRF